MGKVWVAIVQETVSAGGSTGGIYDIFFRDFVTQTLRVVEIDIDLHVSLWCRFLEL